MSKTNSYKVKLKFKADSTFSTYPKKSTIQIPEIEATAKDMDLDLARNPVGMAMATAELNLAGAAHKAEAASREEEGVHDSRAGEGERCMNGGQKPPRQRLLPLITTPLILMAAVLLWNCGGEQNRNRWQWSAADLAGGTAKAYLISSPTRSTPFRKDIELARSAAVGAMSMVGATTGVHGGRWCSVHGHWCSTVLAENGGKEGKSFSRQFRSIARLVAAAATMISSRVAEVLLHGDFEP
ncbi:hypothetical protein PIB30_098258 [Stylosanthes scabra]|uniref:Uncharacterized protein n=1 Tax=Stylosanthes scabra TaxID=79078 RepID=A0ABU6VUY3_9FABA|nr:hypothetical protein [Stylosanthes scabra]